MQPLAGHQGEKLSTSLCPSPPQKAAESNEVTPSFLFSKPDKPGGLVVWVFLEQSNLSRRDNGLYNQWI